MIDATELQPPTSRRAEVEQHGIPVDEFIREYGAGCYAAILADCGGDVDLAHACITLEFAFATTTVADFMDYMLFDLHVGEFDEAKHPYLREAIDLEGLAEARRRAGLIRIVPCDGRLFCFARCTGWIGTSTDGGKS